MSLWDKTSRYAPLFTYAPVALGPVLHAPEEQPSQRKDNSHAESGTHDDEGEREDFSVEAASPGAGVGAAASPGVNVDLVNFSPTLRNGADNTFQGVEGQEPMAVYVGTIQPVTPAGADGGGSMRFRWMALIAPRGERAVLGGLRPGASVDVVPAPILIEDSVVDETIECGPNVRFGRNVTMVKVTHSLRR